MKTNLEFRYDGDVGGYEVFGVIGNAKRVIIPRTYKGVPVVRIEDNAFEDCESLEYIEIPETISSIGNYAFFNCIALKSVVILDGGLVKICEGAFQNCRSLQSIYLPKSIKTISAAAFKACISLKSIVIPEGITSVKGQTFCGCSALESITFPKTLLNIGVEACASCQSLKEVEIPDSVTTIDHFAFCGCPIKSVEIPEHVESLGRSVFTNNAEIVRRSESARALKEENTRLKEEIAVLKNQLQQYKLAAKQSGAAQIIAQQSEGDIQENGDTEDGI